VLLPVLSVLAGMLQSYLLLMTLILGSEFIGADRAEGWFGAGCLLLFILIVAGMAWLFNKDRKLAGLCLAAAIAGFIVTPVVLWLRNMS